MKISCIIPIFNMENYLSRCLESIRNQTLNDFECILINDGSTDNSLEICQYYSNIDSRFKVYSVEKQGVSHARNTGLLISSGDYICFIDADDYVDNKYFSSMYELVRNSQFTIGACVFYHEASKYQTETEVLSFDDEKQLCRHLFSLDSQPVIKKIFPRKVILDFSIFFAEDVFIGEDLLFNLCVIKYIKTLKTIPDNLYHYEVNPNSATRKKYKEKYLESSISLINYINDKISEYRISKKKRQLYMAYVLMQTKNSLILNALAIGNYDLCKKEITKISKKLTPYYKLPIRTLLAAYVKINFRQKIYSVLFFLKLYYFVWLFKNLKHSKVD